MVKLKDLLDLIEILAPRRLAAEWDNPGLAVGHKEARIQKIALSLDAIPETIQAAIQIGAQALVTHHPLSLNPLRRLDLSEPIAETAALAIKHNLAVVSAHTNLDAARQGTARALARHLDLKEVSVLEPVRSAPAYKLTVFVPLGYEGQIKQALLEAGAGSFFQVRGEKTYSFGAEDRAGTAGPRHDETQAESRLEVRVADNDMPRILEALRRSHPYEEPAWDLSPLAPAEPTEGYGCIGVLNIPLSLGDLVNKIKESLKINFIRIAGPDPGQVRTVALMPGSGGAYVSLARSRGAQVLLSGDLGYHQAREAEQIGLTLLDAGHFATERPVIEDLANLLDLTARKRAWDLSFIVLDCEKDPWRLMEV
ncbi:MAG: Nif3-like dinuclear metal center hexameric protein [Thermodesulfobacteriota bacterium]